MSYFRDKKQTVEQCLFLDMKFVNREAFLKAWFATEQVSWFSDFQCHQSMENSIEHPLCPLVINA